MPQGQFRVQDDYKLPLLYLLDDLPDGQGERRDIHPEFASRYYERIPNHHLEILQGGLCRWRENLDYSRLRLSKDGLLDGSQTGIWRLTPAGKVWLEEHWKQIRLESFARFRNDGLERLFVEISPIEDLLSRALELHFLKHSWGDPMVSESECRQRGLTYASRLKVDVRIVARPSGEIKEQSIFMGDFPLMTPRGTFIVEGSDWALVGKWVRLGGLSLPAPAVGELFEERFRAALRIVKRIAQVRMIRMSSLGTSHLDFCTPASLIENRPVVAAIEMLLRESDKECAPSP